MKEKAVFNWSGGKDSALALYKVLREGRYEVTALLTTLNRASRRSSMHDIPMALLEKQAESIGIPLYAVDLTPQGTMGDYGRAMERACRHFLARGVTHFIFGDIFLHDVRSYRERQLAPLGVRVVEPLWDRTPGEVMEEFLASGLRSVVVTVTEGMLDKRFLGRELDRRFVNDLPPEADVCGEQGEYHTFCYAGGMFRSPVPFSLGTPQRRAYSIRMEDGSEREYAYWFADLQAGAEPLL